LQRCRRLQCEMNELMDEISVIQSDKATSKEDQDSYAAVSSVVSTAKKILESLKLEQVLGKETVINANDAEIKNLIGQVEAYKKSGGLENIKITPACELAQTTRIAELEHRLHQLETIVGAKTEKISRLVASMGTNSLMEAVQQLSTKAALLQPGQLDLVEARLNNLATKMDTIAEKSSGSNQEAVRDQKVCYFLFYIYIQCVYK